MYYHKLNQVVTLIAAAVQYVILLLKQINTSLGNCYVATYLTNALFPFPVHYIHQRQFAFGWQG